MSGSGKIEYADKDQLTEDEFVEMRKTRFKCNYQPSQSNKKLHCKDGTRTQQQFKDDANINNILKKHARNNTLTELLRKDPEMYGDFSSPMEFREAMDVINMAQYQFENLSAEIRARFQNDPANFLAFASDASNAEEMAKMGLMDPKAVKRVTEAQEAKKKKDFDNAVNTEIEKRTKKEPKKDD